MKTNPPAPSKPRHARYFSPPRFRGIALDSTAAMNLRRTNLLWIILLAGCVNAGSQAAPRDLRPDLNQWAQRNLGLLRHAQPPGADEPNVVTLLEWTARGSYVMSHERYRDQVLAIAH